MNQLKILERRCDWTGIGIVLLAIALLVVLIIFES